MSSLKFHHERLSVCFFLSFFLLLLSIWLADICSLLLQCSFMSAETVWTVRDGEPRTSTSTFAQLLSSEDLSLNVSLRPQRPYGLLGAGSPGCPRRLRTVPETTGCISLNIYGTGLICNWRLTHALPELAVFCLGPSLWQ